MRVLHGGKVSRARAGAWGDSAATMMSQMRQGCSRPPAPNIAVDSRCTARSVSGRRPEHWQVLSSRSLRQYVRTGLMTTPPGPTA